MIETTVVQVLVACCDCPMPVLDTSGYQSFHGEPDDCYRDHLICANCGTVYDPEPTTEIPF